MLPDSVHKLLRLPYLLKTARHGHGKQTIVFLHGIASYKEIWQPALQALERDYTCITVDLLGHGKSPKPINIDYSVTAHLRSLRWTLFWKGIWGKKIVVGYSMGGIIATHWARIRPRSITKLVLVSMPIYRRSEGVAARTRLELMIDQGYLTFYKVLRNAPRNFVIRSAKTLLEHMRTLSVQATLDEATWYPVVSSLKCTIEEQTTLEDIERLRKDLPAEILYGSLDQVVLASNLKHAFADRPHTHITRVTAPHEIKPRMYHAIVRAITRASGPDEQPA